MLTGYALSDVSSNDIQLLGLLLYGVRNQHASLESRPKIDVAYGKSESLLSFGENWGKGVHEFLQRGTRFQLTAWGAKPRKASHLEGARDALGLLRKWAIMLTSDGTLCTRSRLKRMKRRHTLKTWLTWTGGGRQDAAKSLE